MRDAAKLVVLLTVAAILGAVTFAKAAGTVPALSGTWNVQRNGVFLFCATNLDPRGNVYNYTGDCAAPPPPPAGRIATSNIAYVPATGTVRFTAVTECSAIWGHASPFDAEVPEPGRPNSQPTILNFTRAGFVSCHFKAATSGASFGWTTHTEYNYGGDLTWSISQAPGDFAPADPLCHGAATSGQVLFPWTTKPTIYRGRCGLVPGADYYRNMKLTNPAQGSTTCALTSPQCAIGTANSFGG